MIKREFEIFFGECKFYLYVVIFNEGDVEKSGQKRRKEVQIKRMESELFKKNKKENFIEEEGIFVRGL